MTVDKDKPEGNNMDHVTGVREYFHKYVPQSYRCRLLVRTVNGLLRGGIETMDDLSRCTDEDILRIWNIGMKSFEVAVMMRDQYAAEKAKSHSDDLAGQ